MNGDEEGGRDPKKRKRVHAQKWDTHTHQKETRQKMKEQAQDGRSVDGHSHVVIHRGLGLKMKLRFRVQVLGSCTVDE